MEGSRCVTGKALPKAREILESPYESEARYAIQRGRHWVGHWVGYKAHLTPEL